MAMFNRIVAAVDFSEISSDVLRYAVQLAATSPGAHLHVLHVVPDPLEQAWTVETAGLDFAQLTRDEVTDAEQRLADLINAEGFAAASAKPVVLVGKAADAIAEYASGLPADLIVLGTHGYGPFKRFVLGSVAERVLRHATCPIVTLPRRHTAAAPIEVRATRGATLKSA